MHSLLLPVQANPLPQCLFVSFVPATTLADKFITVLGRNGELLSLSRACEDEVALSKLTEGWYIQRPRSSQGRLKLETTIVIQDPFELTRNVSGNLSVRKLDRIVTMFRAAALVLGVVVRNNIGANMDTVFRLLFTPGFEMTEEFSKLIED